MLMTVAGLRKPLPLNYEGRCIFAFFRIEIFLVSRMRLGGSRGNSGQFGNGPLGIIKSRNREKITPQASLV